MSLSVVLSAWKLPGEQVARFLEWNRKAFAKVDEIVVVADRPFEVTSPARCVVYPLRQPVFSLARTSNYGIRRATGEIIVKTDLDIAFSCQLVENIPLLVKPGVGLCCVCSQIEQPATADTIGWKSQRLFRCGNGACVALCREDWAKTCGYDERLSGWGGEDNEFVVRAGRTTIVAVSNEFPLYHVTHPLRKGTREFPDKGRYNRRDSLKHDWNNPAWGDPLGELRKKGQ